MQNCFCSSRLYMYLKWNTVLPVYSIIIFPLYGWQEKVSELLLIKFYIEYLFWQLFKEQFAKASFFFLSSHTSCMLVFTSPATVYNPSFSVLPDWLSSIHDSEFGFYSGGILGYFSKLLLINKLKKCMIG